MLLLHAILAAESVKPPRAGLRGWPLREVRVGELTGWATHCGEPTFSPGREDLLAQHALLQNALGACVPVRFPTWLADEAAVRELLARRHAGLLAALEHVRGRVELAVTTTWAAEGLATPVSVIASSPGRRFLEERRRQYAESDQRRAAAERVARLIEADDGVMEARHSLSNLGLSSAVLVRADDALAVAERLRELREGVRILVNGPWPPYSFVSLEG